MMDLEVEDLFDRFSVNQKELGKVLIIASFTLLVVSLHSFYVLNDIETGASEMEEEVDRTVTLLESDQFNSSLEALRDVEAFGVQRKVETVIAGMNDVQSSLSKPDNLTEQARESKEAYQWLSLIGLLGLISGLILFILER